MRVFIAIFLSVLSGIVAHAIFYPIVSSWHNEKLRLLSRPAIGVSTNLPVFIVWTVALYRAMTADDKPLKEWQVVLLATLAYLVSFLLHGSGVTAGHVVDDLMDNS
jgi:threonine/homoserine/homoserine lactone efflux protein